MSSITNVRERERERVGRAEGGGEGKEVPLHLADRGQLGLGRFGYCPPTITWTVVLFSHII